MEAYAGMTDILLGYDTDLHFENGDLMLTSGVDYIERELYKLLITEMGDWGANRRIGASPERYIGEQNKRETGLAIKEYLQQQLRDTVLPAQLTVRVVPTDYTSIIIFIDVLVQDAEVTSIPFTFDLTTGKLELSRRDERVTPIRSSQTHKVNDNRNMKTPNKYWENIRQQRQF